MRVAIIGAGIIGLYLAWKLAERGEKVTVFEKKGNIGKEACSGLFSERILKFVPLSQKLIEHEINSVLIHFPKRTIKVKFSKKFLVMNHAELDRLVAGLAQNSGAKIILNHHITGSFPVTFDRVIGCDGAHSAVRKSLGLKEPDYRLGIQGIEGSGDEAKLHLYLRPASRDSVVETWPTKFGFIWKIPRGNNVEYGIMEKPQDARLLLDQFLEKNNLNLEGVNSAIIPQGLIVSKNPTITLCGDAAGLTKPWSGGGVIWGLTAADLLLKNFPDFVKYQKAMKRFFAPKILFSKVAIKMAYFGGFNLPWLLPKKISIEGDFLV